MVNDLNGVTIPGNSQGQMFQPSFRLRTLDGSQSQVSPLFQVNSVYVVLTAFNLSINGKAKVYMRDVDSGLDSPWVVGGVNVELNHSNTRVILDVPGFYVLYYNDVPDFSCVVTMHEMARTPVPRRAPTASTGAVGATGATGPAGLSAAFDAYLPVTFVYTNGNAIIEYNTPKHIVANNTFTWDNQVFTPTNGLFKFEAGLRVTGLSGGTFARLRIMSGLNTVAEDRYDWTKTCPVTAVTMLVSALTASTDVTNKLFHVQIETDATLTSAIFWPDMCYVVGFRVSDPPPTAPIGGPVGG